MSQSVRQNRLFAAEDWQAIYRSFQSIDFTAYDFDTLRNAMIDYIRTQYPEDFNDYIESSEFIAMIELLAYLGTSLSFRHDLNTRENFLDTAERRDSIVRLARMLSYTPRRNITASGVFKVTAVQTNQPVQDSLGRNLSNATVFWNDPNNPDALEQFTTILNAAFDPNHTFGRPYKSGTIGNIPTDLYRLRNENSQIAYNVTIPVRGEKFPFDIVNPDFEDGRFFFERHPDPADPFYMIYRNDGEGLGSANTGFFLLFKQGTLQNVDVRFDTPIRNRTLDVDINNVNEADVYVQEIDEAGSVVNKWQKVPALIGSNVVYNSLNNQIRNIFSVIPRLNDQITLKFADGNFGNIPTGIFRSWVRTSANRKIVVRPEDVRNFDVNIPYTGADGQQYRLRLVFTLEQTIANGESTEANFQIKERAPQVFYSQNRMVNGEDYNVFPLTRGNEILKLKAINRTHAGHSRFIDLNDPTGTYQNVTVFGDDAALYSDSEPARTVVSGALSTEDIAKVSLQNFVDSNTNLYNFFSSVYLDEFETEIDTGNPFEVVAGREWETGPRSISNETGFFTIGSAVSPASINPYITEGTVVKFSRYSDGEDVWAKVLSIIDAGNGPGLPNDETSLTEVGPVELNAAIERRSTVTGVVPALRTKFNNAELAALETQINLQADFGIGYDINNGGEWYVVPGTPSGTEEFALVNNGANEISRTSTSEWLIFASYNAADNNWSFVTRGKRYIFESLEDVRFFFDPQKIAVDIASGLPLRDEIQILKTNTVSNTDLSILGSTVKVQPHRLVMYEDGHQDPRKVEVIAPDVDDDGLADDPLSVENFLASSGPQTVYFERFTDFDGYEYFQLWRGVQYDLVNAAFSIFESAGNWEVNVNGTFRSLSECDMITNTSSTPAAIESAINTDPGSNTNLINAVDGLIIYYPTDDTFYKIEKDVGGTSVIVEETNNYYTRQGRSFKQNTDGAANPLYFKLVHYAPRENRIDPSISNVIDMMVLTNTYYRDLLVWKDSNDITVPVPQEPTTEDLRIQFSLLEDYKMLSDQIIFKPGKFKLLFGNGSAPELRARFKVVKLPNVTATDNEIRSGVINAIDEYFDVANWDFGESFFYTELSAYIHQRLANLVASVVIVPQKEESVFGNLFQVKAEADELFLSTAAVTDVEIVRNLTETNLRVRR